MPLRDRTGELDEAWDIPHRSHSGRDEYLPTHRESAGSRGDRWRFASRGTEVVFLADIHGVPFPDAPQRSFSRGDRARIPDDLVPRLKRRGHILTLEG